MTTKRVLGLKQKATILNTSPHIHSVKSATKIIVMMMIVRKGKGMHMKLASVKEGKGKAREDREE